MTTFYNEIAVPGQGDYIFSFSDSLSIAGELCIVFVLDQKHKVYRIKMKQIDGVWNIVNAKELPEWILELETELSKAISDQ